MYRLYSQFQYLVSFTASLGPVRVGALDDDTPYIGKLVEQGLDRPQANILIVNQDTYLPIGNHHLPGVARDRSLHPHAISSIHPLICIGLLTPSS